MWQPASQMNSSPGWQCTRMPIWFDMRARRDEDGRFLAEQFGHPRSQGRDGGIFVEHVVAHLGGGHGGPHGRRSVA